MKLFNTLSNSVEELRRHPSGKFSMYFCGPTVYNYAHIGNFRTYLLQDVLVRTLEVEGYNPCVVRNITDVDDKTIRDSMKNNISLKDFTEKWIKIFHDDCRALNIKIPDFEPRATDHIFDQIVMIQQLIDKNYAYVTSDGCVYFRISSFEKYGMLSNLKNRELKPQISNSAGEYNLADEYDRENISDFALWKSKKPEDGENFWKSPWGDGRPGWHIECSAMAKKYLGESIDLHSGGEDLKFPHHENEIAQSECANHKVFAKYWIHISHLLVNGTKMSKSLGNLYTLQDILNKNYSANCLRYSLISAHYRQQLNFTFNSLKSSENALKKLRNFFIKISKSSNIEYFIIQEWKFLGEAFEFLLDDLNTPACLGGIFKTINEVELEILSDDDKKCLFEEFSTLMYCLGVRFDGPDPSSAIEIPDEIKRIAEDRWIAKQSRNFSKADEIRQHLSSLGWMISDEASGYEISKIRS